jgi:hypothetical protein
MDNDRRGRKQAQIRQPQVIHGRAGKGFDDVFQIIGQIPEQSGSRGDRRINAVNPVCVKDPADPVKGVSRPVQRSGVGFDPDSGTAAEHPKPGIDGQEMVAGAIQIPAGQQHHGPRTFRKPRGYLRKRCPELHRNHIDSFQGSGQTNQFGVRGG